MNRTSPTIRLFLALLLAFAIIPAFVAPASADHDPDHPHEPGADCAPELEITGGRVPDAVPNPWGLDPLYAGWTTVDLILPDGCECFIESWTYGWATEVDNPLYGQSAGVDVTQVDTDTWLVHNLDADVYEVKFTVYVFCDGEMYPLTATWYQFN